MKITSDHMCSVLDIDGYGLYTGEKLW